LINKKVLLIQVLFIHKEIKSNFKKMPFDMLKYISKGITGLIDYY